MTSGEILVFALEDTRDLGSAVAASLGIRLGDIEELSFNDGEHKTRPLVNARGKDVYVIQSLYGSPRRSVNDKLARLLFFAGALRDASASRITAIVPYLAFSRQDRQILPRDPITSKYVALLMEASGIQHVVTLDVHNLAAFQNAFRCQTDHLEASRLFANHFARSRVPLGLAEHLCVVSPDAGGIKRARSFLHALAESTGVRPAMAFIDKTRENGKSAAHRLIGEVSGADVIVYDDMISTGQTLSLAVKMAKDQGARRVFAAATHGLFCGPPLENPPDGIVITDSVNCAGLEAEPLRSRTTILQSSDLFADAIRSIHAGDALSTRAWAA